MHKSKLNGHFLPFFLIYSHVVVSLPREAGNMSRTIEKTPHETYFECGVFSLMFRQHLQIKFILKSGVCNTKKRFCRVHTLGTLIMICLDDFL